MAGVRDRAEQYALAFLVSGNTNPDVPAVAGFPRFLHLFTTDPPGDGDLIGGATSTPAFTMTGEIPHDPQGYRPQPAGTWLSAAGVSRNSDARAFTSLPACTVVAWGLSYDAGSGYVLLLTGLFAQPIVVPAGGTVVIPAGALTITAD